MGFRNETFVSRALKNPKMRGCPVCLREDAQTSTGAPLEEMAMRGDWQLREVSICVKHQHPLVVLWERTSPTERFNISTRLGNILPQLLDGSFEMPPIIPSAYDIWLDKRLEDGSDASWLAEYSIYAASTFCRLLGAELLRLPENAGFDSHDRIRAAQSAGFDVAIGGETSINYALDELAAHASSHNDLPNKAFGGLYKALARPYLHEECFDAFRRILWERIVAIWPVAADEVILGHSLPERRLHSLQSAVKETGLGTFLLDQFLIEAGAYSKEDDRSAPRKTFDVNKYASLLAEVPDLVGPIEMSKAMGATLKQLKRLAEDGCLSPGQK
ncbi:TniQ domain containing protein [Sulfitobacter noctilucae]|nr:TniQ domain containing protein [Sulfitobacter noctilucae]